MKKTNGSRAGTDDNPLWYKDAVIYQLHVRSFFDGNGDGIGDFAGLTAKLDYLQDLGVQALWLLPFFPSPLKDDGYDVSGYTDVHPDYGTLHDFGVFLGEAHRRGIRVIVELALNHTSNRHPWFERILTDAPAGTQPPRRSLWDWVVMDPRSPEATALLGHHADKVLLLGQRTAQMHRVLSSCDDDDAFSPEPFTPAYQRSLFQSMRNGVLRVMAALRRASRAAPDSVPPEARRVLDLQPELVAAFRRLVGRRFASRRIRCHGSFKLGHVLSTGKDVVIIDFEGDPCLPLSERRIKRSALRDVATMIRSLHYAAHGRLLKLRELRPGDAARLEPWVDAWCGAASGLFLGRYIAEAWGTPFLPASREELEALLCTFLLERAVAELELDLANRPGWAAIPARAIEEILGYCRGSAP